MTRLKKLVYKNRVRLRDFFVDFDKLRKGEIHPTHFTRGLAMAGVDKFLSPKEIQVICDHYTVSKTASMDVMKYTEFLHDVDLIFTKPVSRRVSHSLSPLALAKHCTSCSVNDSHAEISNSLRVQLEPHQVTKQLSKVTMLEHHIRTHQLPTTAETACNLLPSFRVCSEPGKDTARGRCSRAC